MAIELHDDRITEFAILIEEAARSTEEGVKFFVEPAAGVLQRAKSRRHHLIFGRRGSGKSSLVAKVARELTLARTPAAKVDLEPFKGHSYPDLLLSVLIETLGAFKSWLESYATAKPTKRSIWSRLFQQRPIAAPLNQKEVSGLIDILDAEREKLIEQLYLADDADIQLEAERNESRGKSTSASLNVKADVLSVGVGRSTSSESGAVDRTREQYRRAKVDFLRRRVLVHQNLFDELKRVSGGDAFLLLDDLYHIRRTDQAAVVDYLHSVAKGHGLWLKIGTIRHRTTWYIHGGQPQGMKLGDDADEINLDLTLERYRTTKDFLLKILAKLAEECGLTPSDFLTDGTLDRLVLASGGVARDLLGVLRRSIDQARERDDLDRRPKVGAEDVNKAAGEYDSTKRDEFVKDTYTEEEEHLQSVFKRLKDFCLETANCNCFLIQQEAASTDAEKINELVDLKLLHRIRSRVTINTASQKGKLFEAYMLDLSQYSASRKRRGLEMIEFWKAGADLKLRKASLIFDPN